MHLWIKAWEDRASKLEMSSKSHAFNDELRRQVFMESLPKDVKEMVEIEKNKRQLGSHAELRQWLINLGTNSSLSTSVTPAQLVINQVSETPQNAAQYFAQPQNDESEYSPDDWMCYMCTPEGADFAQANPMLPEIGQALLAFNQRAKGGKYGGGKVRRKGAAKTGTGKFQGKCWNCNEEGHTAAECKKPRKPKGYGKGAPKGGKKGYGKGGGASNINTISEDWTLCLHDDSPDLMLNYLHNSNDQILGNRTV